MTIKEVSKKYGISQDTLRYYERVNVIPKVTRTSGGIRDYQEEDLRWVELAVCMRNAGLPIESLIEYQRLFRAGDSTIPARLGNKMGNCTSVYSGGSTSIFHTERTSCNFRQIWN